MNDERVLGELIEAARSLGIEVRRVALESEVPGARGGLVTLRGRKVVFIDRAMDTDEQVGLLARALAAADTENLYLSPAARAIIEDSGAE